MKMKHLLLIPILLFLLASIAYRIQFFDSILNNSISTTVGYHTNANIAAILTVLLGVVYIALFYIEKGKKMSVESILEAEIQQESFKKELNNILSRLKNLAKNSEYNSNAKTTVEQISKINEYIEKFNNLYIGESIDVFSSVNASLELAKKQFVQNAKSIVNHIIIEDCEAEIAKRITSNQKIIEDVKALLNETVNYLDNKSSTASSPLEDITSSLKTLNETIF